jgi:hypothetical protein
MTTTVTVKAGHKGAKVSLETVFECKRADDSEVEEFTRKTTWLIPNAVWEGVVSDNELHVSELDTRVPG